MPIRIQNIWSLPHRLRWSWTLLLAWLAGGYLYAGGEAVEYRTLAIRSAALEPMPWEKIVVGDDPYEIADLPWTRGGNPASKADLLRELSRQGFDPKTEGLLLAIPRKDRAGQRFEVTSVTQAGGALRIALTLVERKPADEAHIAIRFPAEPGTKVVLAIEGRGETVHYIGQAPLEVLFEKARSVELIGVLDSKTQIRQNLTPKQWIEQIHFRRLETFKGGNEAGQDAHAAVAAHPYRSNAQPRPRFRRGQKLILIVPEANADTPLAIEPTGEALEALRKLSEQE